MARRSVLFSPGDRPEMLRRAPDTGADTVVFDLEDGVAPARKDPARTAVSRTLSEIDPSCEVCVRINPVESGARSDLATILSATSTLDGIVVPKVSSERDIDRVTSIVAEHGVDLPVLALIETAAGVLSAPDLAAMDATDALVFGAEDLAADVGATRTSEGTEVSHARQAVVLAASAAGIDAIDTLYTDYEDTDGLATEATSGAHLGFDGKLAVHPTQVPVINEAFTPDEARIEWARRVLAAREEEIGDRGVFTIEGEMIDRPLIRQAETVLERAGVAEYSEE